MIAFVCGNINWTHSACRSQRRPRRRGVDVFALDGQVVVLGATGGTGKFVVKELLTDKHTCKVRGVVNDPVAAKENLGEHERLELVAADVKKKDDALRAAVGDAEVLISCVGAGNNSKWGANNRNLVVLGRGMANVVDCLTTGTIKKFVYLSATGTKNSTWVYKLLDFATDGGWSGHLLAEIAIADGAEEKNYDYVIVHGPSLRSNDSFDCDTVIIRPGDANQPKRLRRDLAATIMIECAERDLGKAVEISPYGVQGPATNWDAAFKRILQNS